MLKILKIQVNVELIGDPEDHDDLRDRLYEYLKVSMEDNDLEFTVEDEESEEVYSED